MVHLNAKKECLVEKVCLVEEVALKVCLDVYRFDRIRNVELL